MLLQEAALSAGLGARIPLLGRPTCMALPATLAHGVVVSTGCTGNRVYTDLEEDELYVGVPGKDLARIANEVETIAAAKAVRYSHLSPDYQLAAVERLVPQPTHTAFESPTDTTASEQGVRQPAHVN